MKISEFLEYIAHNLEEIYNNLISVFELKPEETRTLLINLAKSYDYNPDLEEKDCDEQVFSEEQLRKLKEYLTEVGLTEEEINRVIVKSPLIILHSIDLSSIYCIYKKDKYYGYSILDNDKINTFLLNDNLPSNVISNNHITDVMLEYYGVNKPSKEALDKIVSKYKLKNYYFKKPNQNKEK